MGLACLPQEHTSTCLAVHSETTKFVHRQHALASESTSLAETTPGFGWAAVPTPPAQIDLVKETMVETLGFPAVGHS